MKYITNHRINVRTIRNIADNQGLTLRNGKIVEYRTGWQVGITGIEVKTKRSAKFFIMGSAEPATSESGSAKVSTTSTSASGSPQSKTP